MGSGWGKAGNKAKLSPAGAGSWSELGNKKKTNDPYTRNTEKIEARKRIEREKIR